MMRYKGYIGRVEFDADARVLHGEVIGIRDVVTFQADSAGEIEKAFHDSVDDYLDFCRERGEKPDRPHSGHFVVRTDSDLHRRLTAVAQALGKSLNTLVVEFLSREVDQVLPQTKGRRQPSGKDGAADAKPRLTSPRSRAGRKAGRKTQAA